MRDQMDLAKSLEFKPEQITISAGTNCLYAHALLLMPEMSFVPSTIPNPCERSSRKGQFHFRVSVCIIYNFLREK